MILRRWCGGTQRCRWCASEMRQGVHRLSRCCSQSRSLLPQMGTSSTADRPGTAIHQGGLIAKLATPNSSQAIEIRSPIPGRIRSVSQAGANVTAGAEVAVDRSRDRAGLGGSAGPVHRRADGRSGGHSSLRARFARHFRPRAAAGSGDGEGDSGSGGVELAASRRKNWSLVLAGVAGGTVSRVCRELLRPIEEIHAAETRICGRGGS